jgi:predicted nucleic acid-binding protein
MNLVDSSGWLEYLADGQNANFFAEALEKSKDLLVPALCIYEVFKRVLQQRDEPAAIQTAMLMQQGKVVDVDVQVAMSAAKLSHELKLPMADSIILAIAKSHQAIVWTQDEDFAALKNIKFVAKRRK